MSVGYFKMLEDRLAKLLLVCFLVVQISCAGMYKQELSFDPAEPLRVAVLPFYQLTPSGELLTMRDDVYLIDHIPGVSEKVEESPARFVQGLVETELRQTGFDLMPTVAVESALLHGGFRTKQGINLKKVLEADANTLCRVIGCDAVFYGRISKWERAYYVVQSVSTVGLEVRLVRAVDGAAIFSAASEDSDSRGLTKGPTGYTSLVIEPIRGLDSGIITELASKVVKETIKPLETRRSDKAALVAPPVIFASSHDAVSGSLATDGRLVVLAFATPGASAAFSIGSYIRDVPMFETYPGHYIGEFYPVEGDRFEMEPVQISVRDGFGRTAQQTATKLKVSLRPQGTSGAMLSKRGDFEKGKR